MKTLLKLIGLLSILSPNPNAQNLVDNGSFEELEGMLPQFGVGSAMLLLGKLCDAVSAKFSFATLPPVRRKLRLPLSRSDRSGSQHQQPRQFRVLQTKAPNACKNLPGLGIICEFSSCAFRRRI